MFILVGRDNKRKCIEVSACRAEEVLRTGNIEEHYKFTKMVSRMEKRTITKLPEIGDKTELNNWRGIKPLSTIKNFFHKLSWTEGNTKLMQN